MWPLLVALLLQEPVTGKCAFDDAGVPAIFLSPSTQKVLQVGPAAALRSSTPGVVELRLLSATQLLVMGSREGSTRVAVEQADGGVRTWLVHVQPMPEWDLRISDVAKEFPCGSTLESRMVGERIYLEGEASTEAEWRAALTVDAKYPNVIVLGRLAQEVIDRGFLEAQWALRAANFPRVKWVRAGDAVLLEGTVAEDGLRALRALEARWRPRLELLVARPRQKATALSR